jgi:hypothetical protein
VSDPALALQGAIVTELKATGGVGTGVRVYDEPPPPDILTFPYVQIGDDQVIGDDVECAELSEVFTRIHVWSRSPAGGFVEAKTIATAIRARIRSTTFSLSGFTVDEVQFVQTQYLRDPDGITRHAVIEIRFFIQHD